jgi:hypothetical protein
VRSVAFGGGRHLESEDGARWLAATTSGEFAALIALSRVDLGRGMVFPIGKI